MGIQKILIANRGEIAIRIIATCRLMGIRTVAVFSSADADAMHAKLADEAVALGEAGYLSIPALLDAARASGTDAIHPGYGFLSERAEFSEACAAAGIRFIGPGGEAMRRIGDKISAKSLAREVGVPLVPGFFAPGASLSEVGEAARKIGFPVMIKAAAGGGGRGMRVVRSGEDLAFNLQMASEEALSAFGDGAMMVEKLIERPRHVEVQVIADTHGNVACLFERECSIQRRHQKLIEEAPAPLLLERPEMWEAMRDAAERLIRAAGYSNAGTVEFIVDCASGSFFFLEVNARLQVEHPVTEAVTGLDLVRLQIEVADGLPVSFWGDRAGIWGHAIEARVIAEDPDRGFLPSVGQILGWAAPRAPGVRVDSGFEAGQRISPNYDSLIAKVIAHGANREEAIGRLTAALNDFHVLGVRTNIGYLLDILGHPDFVRGGIDTGFLERLTVPAHEIPPELSALVGAASSPASGVRSSAVQTAWSVRDGFRNI